MMRIDLPLHARMSETGSSLLRLIQNKETPTLDLLVREAIQNSLDAALAEDTHKSVDIHIACGTFETSALAKHFESIGKKLREQYPGTRSFLALKDCNTTGLTGPVRSKDVRNQDFGNLQKLVYEISKPQKRENAGGSWGLGKTVYFRTGIGFVIYYSRIFRSDTNAFETRLAAVLVEDETKETTLLEKTGSIDRGIAWWGEKEHGKNAETIPLINSREGDEILSVFGIPPCTGQETGTTVLIPLIDEEKLLAETVVSDNTIPSRPIESIADYLKLAVQKWYAPRLSNPAYPYGKYLRVSINGQWIDTSVMEPFFSLIQMLYNSSPSDPLSYRGKPLCSKKITLLNVFERSSIAGWINFCKLEITDLYSLSAHNLNPYRYLGIENNDLFHPPIIACTRAPGMIVSYETSGMWTAGIPEPEKNSIIIALFVPNSENRIQGTGKTLEEYLRSCETADHMSWSDPAEPAVNGKRYDIIQKIQKHTVRKIKAQFPAVTEPPVPVSPIDLGRLLDETVIPTEDYDEPCEVLKSKRLSSSNSAAAKTKEPCPSSRFSMKLLEEPENRRNTAFIHVLLSFGKKQGGAIEACVLTGTGVMNEQSWKERIETPFPVSIQAIHVHSVSEGKKHLRELFHGKETIQYSRTLCGLCFVFSSESNASSVSITFDQYKPYVLDCTVECTVTDKNLTGRLRFLPMEESKQCPLL